MPVLDEDRISSSRWDRSSAIQPGAFAVLGLAVLGLPFVVKGLFGRLS